MAMALRGFHRPAVFEVVAQLLVLAHELAPVVLVLPAEPAEVVVLTAARPGLPLPV